MANEGLVRDPLLKMVHNPGGDCYWEGGQPKLYSWKILPKEIFWANVNKSLREGKICFVTKSEFQRYSMYTTTQGQRMSMLNRSTSRISRSLKDLFTNILRGFVSSEYHGLKSFGIP